MNRSVNSDDLYDVAIIGAGMAGGILGSVLARNGLKVLLLDAGTHPRFAVGESTIPQTSVMTQIIAERYQVPEVASLSDFHKIRTVISPMSGQKRNFGFVYHEEGKPQDPKQINQEVIPVGVEAHLFRQDVDAYFYHLAVRYGADGMLATRIADVEIDPDAGVELLTDRQERFRARYIVDASGFRSPLAEKLGLRDEPTRARHHSRTLFTHMVGVSRFDDTETARPHNQNVPWHEGTLHHVFDGGWLWVIPFDNHDGALNTLCSVGLTVDERVFPKPDLPPEREFQEFLSRFPEIAVQFENARAVRPWVSTTRLQYSSHTTVGDRYCLTAHASGFIDALYSRGLTNTMDVVNSLAHRLIEAARSGDWSTERFKYLDAQQQGLFGVHDDLVYCSFVAFRHYPLWNAVLRVWRATSFLTYFAMVRALADFRETGDEQTFRALEPDETPGLPGPAGPDVAELLAYTRRLCQDVEAERTTPEQAAQALFARLSKSDFLPEPFGFGNPEQRLGGGMSEEERRERILAWARDAAPGHIKPLFGLTPA